MRITLRDLALLALPTLSNAVSLSDMTPRATGLPPQCEAVYTTQIYGCTPGDFQSQQCSDSCINALYGISQAIGRACGGQGVSGQNLVVAFLAGVGPQQLCHNARGSDGPPGPPSSYTRPHGPPTHWSPTIGSSTTTARKPTNTKSLLVDTSSTMTATMIPSSSSTAESSSDAQSTTTRKTSPSPSPSPQPTQHNPAPVAGTSTSSAPDNSQTSLNDHSGGGSPFDSEGNMNSAAAGCSISRASTLLSAAAAMLMALR